MTWGGWLVSVFSLLGLGGCRVGAPTAVSPRQHDTAWAERQPPQPPPHAPEPLAAAPGTAITPIAPALTPPSAPPFNLPSDDEFWRRSRDSSVVEAGRATFNASSCRTCHGIALTGGAGPNLTDRLWLHGGTPREVYRTITSGVPSKGMPTWGPVLGPRSVADLVAFIFSFHQPGEAVEVQTSFIPFTPTYP